MFNIPYIDPKLLQALIQQEQAGGILDIPQVQQTQNLIQASVTPQELSGTMFNQPQPQQQPVNLQPATPTPRQVEDNPAPMLPPTNQGVMVSGEGYAMNNLETLAGANNSLLPEGEKFGFETSWMGQNDTYGGPGMSANQEWIDSIDYGAGASGKTIGQVIGSGGNTDPWGRPVQWSEGEITQGAKLGEVVDTPAGRYLVVNGADGQLALKGLEGAMHGGGQYFFNMSKKGHHVGINPLTGDVWHQSAPSVQGIPGVDYWSSIAWDPNRRQNVRGQADYNNRPQGGMADYLYPAANQYQGDPMYGAQQSYPVKGGAMPTYGIPTKGGYSSGYRSQFGPNKGGTP